MKCNNKNYISRLKKGKEDALEFIVDLYLPIVKGVTYKILYNLNNEGIIDECINDIFLSVWNNIDKFKGEEENFKKWICAIAKFKAIDYYRKEIKKAETIFECDRLVDKNLVEDELIQTEDKEEIMKVINSLEPMDRDIFIMRFFLGMRAEEVALKLGITKASVDNRVSRGRKKLKFKLINTNWEVI